MQEKLLLGRVAFREDVVMVIEKIEHLRELERILCDESRLLRCNCDSLHQKSEVAKPRMRRASW